MCNNPPWCVYMVELKNNLPAYICFWGALLGGTMIMLVSDNYFNLWVGLELNLMGLLPLLSGLDTKLTHMVCVKYFIWQALGSAFFIYGFVTSKDLMVLGLFLKLGGAPFHFWVPLVLIHCPWILFFVVSGFQKIGPLFIVSTMTGTTNPALLSTVILLTIVVGSLGGLLQSRIKGVLAYSSLSHLAWLFQSLKGGFGSSYLCFYIFSSFLLIFNLMSLQKMGAIKLLVLLILMLTLAGLPPLLGFFAKVLVLLSTLNSGVFPLLPLIIGSAVSLFYYLGVTFNLLIFDMK